MSESLGAQKGLCVKVHAPRDSSCSSSGKSITQHRARTLGSASPSFAPRWSRKRCRTAFVVASRSATIRIRSPSCAPKASHRWAMTSSPTCCLNALLMPSGSQAAVASPFAPKVRASSVNPSISRRLHVAHPGTTNPLMIPPASTAPRNTENPLVPKSDVRFVNSNPNRKSGRSHPYLAIASA